MTVTRSQQNRSDIKGIRPTGRKKGELFVNFADKMLSVVDGGGSTIDLLSIPFYSSAADYAAGALVVQAGQIYQALGPVNAVPFSAAQWKTVGADAVVTATLAPAVAPLNIGTMWFNPNSSSLYVLYLDGVTKVWRQVANGLVAPSATPPASPQVGQLWWETDTGKLYVWWDDGNSIQWVEASGGFGMPEAPVDGQPYARKDGAWYAVAKKTSDNDNFVFNPGGRASQENGSTINTATSPYFVADQWAREHLLAAGAFSIQRVDTLNPMSDGGYNTCIEAICTVANAAPAATNFGLFEHYIEGAKMARLRWGQANAVPGLLAFMANYPAGTWSVCVSNEALNRNFTATFTITAPQAGTWVLITIPIPAQTTGTWEKYTFKGANITFTLVPGANFVAAAPGWNTVTDKFCAPGTNNLLATVGLTARVTDVRLYADPENTQTLPWFQKEDLGDELREAERFWQQTVLQFYGNTTSGQNYSGLCDLRTPMSVTTPILSGLNLANLNFAATIGSLTFFAPTGINESRASTLTGPARFMTRITANGRF